MNNHANWMQLFRLVQSDASIGINSNRKEYIIPGYEPHWPYTRNDGQFINMCVCHIFSDDESLNNDVAYIQKFPDIKLIWEYNITNEIIISPKFNKGDIIGNKEDKPFKAPFDGVLDGNKLINKIPLNSPRNINGIKVECIGQKHVLIFKQKFSYLNKKITKESMEILKNEFPDNVKLINTNKNLPPITLVVDGSSPFKRCNLMYILHLIKGNKKYLGHNGLILTQVTDKKGNTYDAYIGIASFKLYKAGLNYDESTNASVDLFAQRVILDKYGKKIYQYLSKKEISNKIKHITDFIELHK